MYIKTYVFIFLSLVLNFSINGYICSINSFKRNKAEKYVHILSDVHIPDNYSDENIKIYAYECPKVKFTKEFVDQFRNYIHVNNNLNQIDEFKKIIELLKNHNVCFLIESLFGRFDDCKSRSLFYFKYHSERYKHFMLEAVDVCKSNNLNCHEIDFRVCLRNTPNRIAIYNKIINELLKNDDKLFHEFYSKFIFKHKRELQEIAKKERHKFGNDFLFDLFDMNTLNYLINNSDKKHLVIIVGLSHSTIIKDFLIQHDYINIFNENDILCSLDSDDSDNTDSSIQRNNLIANNIKMNSEKTFFQVLALMKPIKFDKFKDFIHKVR